MVYWLKNSFFENIVSAIFNLPSQKAILVES